VLVVGNGNVTNGQGTNVRVPSYTVLNVCGTLRGVGPVPSSDYSSIIYMRDKSHIHIPNIKLAGRTFYAIFARQVDHLQFGNVDIRLEESVGQGMRMDNNNKKENVKMQDVRIEHVYIEGGNGHGVEFYGVNLVEIGTLIVRNTGQSGLNLNNSTNVHVGLIDAMTTGLANSGYAAFRTANRNGRMDDGNYPTNVVIDKVKVRSGGRGIFCVSESGGLLVREVDIANTENQAVLVQNCYNFRIEGGVITNSLPIRLADSTVHPRFAKRRDLALCNLRISDTIIQENPCQVNGGLELGNVTKVDGDEAWILCDGAKTIDGCSAAPAIVPLPNRPATPVAPDSQESSSTTAAPSTTTATTASATPTTASATPTTASTVTPSSTPTNSADGDLTNLAVAPSCGRELRLLMGIALFWHLS
jgi:hypothetical protein